MRYRGEDVMKIRSENGRIENFQGFTRFVAKSLKIWPIFLKKSQRQLTVHTTSTVCCTAWKSLVQIPMSLRIATTFSLTTQLIWSPLILNTLLMNLTWIRTRNASSKFRLDPHHLEGGDKPFNYFFNFLVLLQVVFNEIDTLFYQLNQKSDDRLLIWLYVYCTKIVFFLIFNIIT